MPAPIITNALIRCTRNDDFPKGTFELVRPDLGLWVFELPEDLDGIIRDLTEIASLLKQLSKGSVDFTLHLAIASTFPYPLRIPKALTALSLECDFHIEVAPDSINDVS